MSIVGHGRPSQLLLSSCLIGYHVLRSHCDVIRYRAGHAQRYRV